MLKKTFSLSFFCTLFCALLAQESSLNQDLEILVNRSQPTVKPKAKWSILIYMQADNDLYNMALEDLNEMTKALACDNINVLVQLDKPETKFTHRLQLKNNKFIELQGVNTEMGINPANELLQAAKWIKADFDAEKFAIMLWNHGGGMIEETRQANWLVPFEFDKESNEDRGILYDDSGTYLSNEDMGLIMQKIKEELGQEVDLLGMDACLMSMLEIAWVVRNSSKWIVASENLESGTGWDYTAWLNALALSQGNLSAKDLALSIANSYQTTYLKKDPGFTHSVIETRKLEELKTALDLLCLDLITFNYYSPVLCQDLVRKAYTDTIRFSDHYADLLHLCQNIEAQIAKHLSTNLARQPSATILPTLDCVRKTTASISKVKQALNQCAVYNCFGTGLLCTGGLSLYFPDIWKIAPNQHYLKSSFAKASLWPKLFELHKK